MSEEPREPGPGDILSYWYLWRWEADEGHAEPLKPRETVVAVVIGEGSRRRALLLPMTKQPPQPGRSAFELPKDEVSRLARGEAARLWVMLDEFNEEPIGSERLSEAGLRGSLSPDVFKALYKAFYEQRARLRRVTRREEGG
jgi:hypothetical protein